MDLIHIRNLHGTGVEVAGRILPPRRCEPFDAVAVQAWLERSDANVERAETMLAFEDEHGTPVDVPGTGGSGADGGTGGGEPTGDAARLAELAPEDFTQAGVPTVGAVSQLLGRQVKAPERDELWAAYQAQTSGGSD